MTPQDSGTVLRDAAIMYKKYLILVGKLAAGVIGIPLAVSIIASYFLLPLMVGYALEYESLPDGHLFAPFGAPLPEIYSWAALGWLVFVVPATVAVLLAWGENDVE
jgi:putative effector of murein hydrolase LrgA (UPF0299 family)